MNNTKEKMRRFFECYDKCVERECKPLLSNPNTTIHEYYECQYQCEKACWEW